MPDITGAFTPEQLQRACNVLVIVANAEVHTETDWSVSGHGPCLVEPLQSSFDAALGILNTETVTPAKQGVPMCGDHVNVARPPDAPR